MVSRPGSDALASLLVELVERCGRVCGVGFVGFDGAGGGGSVKAAWSASWSRLRWSTAEFRGVGVGVSKGVSVVAVRIAAPSCFARFVFWYLAAFNPSLSIRYV